jgi:hypothetical protein
MVGGLVLSQALTLFTTPVIYLYLDELSLRFRRRRKKSGAPASPAAGSPAAGSPAAGSPAAASPLEGV